MCTLESLQTSMYMTEQRPKRNEFSFLFHFMSVVQNLMEHVPWDMDRTGPLTCHQAAVPSALRTDHGYGPKVLAKEKRVIL